MKLQTSLLLSLFFIMACINVKAQENYWENIKQKKSGTLIVHYFENPPFCYMENGKLSGIEIDILHYFSKWVKENKGVDLTLNFVKQESFLNVYNVLESAPVNSVAA